MSAPAFDWVAGLWSALAGVTASVGVICLAASFLDRRRLSPLAAFAVCAFSVATYTVFELMLLRAQTGEAYGELLKWSHVPLVAVFGSAIVFLRLQLRAGRVWLAFTALGLRLAALALNFHHEPNINYTEITSVEQIEFLGGARVAVAHGVVNPWTGVGVLAVVAFLAFVADAMRECWRRGGTIDRRRAVFIGGSYLVAFGGTAANGYLMLFGVIDSVYTLVVPFTVVVVAISGELGADVMAAAALKLRLKQSDLARRRDQEHFALAVDAAQLAPWEFDPVRGEFLLGDRARARLGFGRSDRIDLGRVLDELDPADREAARDEASRLSRIGGEFEFEYRVNRGDASNRWLHTRGRMDIDDEGRVALVRGVTFDVTERREADEQFRMLLEAAAFGMIGLDRDGTIVLASERAERLFGYSREALLGLSVRALIAEGLHAQLSNDIARVFRADVDHPAMEVEVTGRRKDGSSMPLSIGLTAIRFHGDVAVLASVVDLTERKRVEARLEEQRNELSHLTRVTMLSELSGSLAHELNQPLTAILSNAQAALRFLDAEAPDLAEVREILRDVVSDDKRAGEIIQGLRLLLKRGEMRHEDFDLNGVVLNVLRLLRSTIVNANVDVVTDLAPELRPVNGDPVQLQQVVLNLVVNACDAMQGNGAEGRRLLVRTDVQDGRLARVCVSDQGPGIEPESLEMIFEPFFTTKPGGLGLGLSVCRQIVAAHGGRLWARSDPGRGASLLFTLPEVGEARS